MLIRIQTFLLSQQRLLLKTTGQSGSEDTALVIIHLSIFSHVLLNYSHPSIYAVIRVCHCDEQQLGNVVIITGAFHALSNSFVTTLSSSL